MLDLSQWETIGGAAVAGITAAVGLWKKTIKPALDARRKRWDTLIEKVEAIEHQVHPNTNTSLYDMVRRLEDKLDYAEQSQLGLWDLSGIAFWRSNRDGHCIYASLALADIVGLDQTHILGNGWVTNIHPDDQDRVFKAWTDAVTQKRLFAARYRFLHRDGTISTVDGSALALHNKAGELSGFIGVVKEVTRTHAST